MESTKFKVDWIVDPFVGFGNMRLFVVKKGEHSKIEGKKLKRKLFEQMVIKHPNDQQWQFFKIFVS